jgi:UDP-N-acetylglucosamine:LPS N-acetylglucosamine transferase
MAEKRRKVLAISSSGGHWVQLQRLRPAWAGCDVTYATTRPAYASEVKEGRFVLVPDCNRNHPLRVVKTILALMVLFVRLRPDVVISTGAAPGYFAVALGRWFGARTVWIDSVANAEELSMSGRKVGKHAHLWITQWRHLANEAGPRYFGSVL